MTSSLTFKVPLRLLVKRVRTKDKFYYLNLNSYRNWCFQVSNNLKILFKEEIDETIKDLPRIDKKVSISYEIFYHMNKAYDLDNIGSIVSKFTHDALVSRGILEDDNVNFISNVVYKKGGLAERNLDGKRVPYAVVEIIINEQEENNKEEATVRCM